MQEIHAIQIGLTSSQNPTTKGKSVLEGLVTQLPYHSNERAIGSYNAKTYFSNPYLFFQLEDQK
jgi:hypothetical protein